MALWPQNGAIYVALMSIIDQTLLWTYGVWLCEPVDETTGGNAIGARGAVVNGSVNGAGSVGNAGSASNAANGGSPAVVRPSPGTRVLGLLKRFVNPAFVGVMLALILILLGVKVPDIILKPLHTIGNMATPMSLIYLGGLFALTKWVGRPQTLRTLCWPSRQDDRIPARLLRATDRADRRIAATADHP